MTDQSQQALGYAVAGLTGLAAMLLILPSATILGTGGVWAMPGGDPAQALTGHLAYQVPGWHWPLLLAPRLGWPAGTSIAMTDSNPLASVAAKLLAGMVGHPVNLLGAWVALCLVMQPVAAAYALFSLQRSPPPPEAVLAVCVLSLLCPAWLMRTHHLNLLGHFLLVAAFGLAVRMVRAERLRWWPACLLLSVAVLIHPYLFVFAAVMLGAPALHPVLARSGGGWRSLASYSVCCVFPVMLLRVLSGSLGARTADFGKYSMNLLSPAWPQVSGLFGAGLPVIDATGGQYEGYNYQGGGVLLLATAAAFSLWRRPSARAPQWQSMAAVSAPLVLLTLLALTPHVYAGHWLVLRLPFWPWDKIFAPVRATGRAFWMVGYAVLVGSVGVLASHVPRRVLTPLLTAAVVLQVIYTAPWRAAAAAFFAGAGQNAPAFTLPADAALLRIVPACDYASSAADRLRLQAVRQGLFLADMRLAHPPRDADCRKAVADGLGAPFTPGEVRLFLPSAMASLNARALGEGVVCVRVGAGVLCARAAANAPASPSSG